MRRSIMGCCVMAFFAVGMTHIDDATAKKPAAKKKEQLTCFTGVQDRHARIGVELENEKVTYLAFYSKRKPRTCSIDVGKVHHQGRWEENAKFTKVTLIEQSGILLISHAGDSYRFDFRNVDRMKYCGMDGKINGTLVVKRGQSQCVVKGIMNGH